MNFFDNFKQDDREKIRNHFSKITACRDCEAPLGVSGITARNIGGRMNKYYICEACFIKREGEKKQ